MNRLDRQVEALRAWRNERNLTLSDILLREIAKRHGVEQDVAHVAKMLSVSQKPFAEEMVAVLTSIGPDPEDRGDADGKSAVSLASPPADQESQPGPIGPRSPSSARPTPGTPPPSSTSPSSSVTYADAESLAARVAEFVEFDFSTLGTTEVADLRSAVLRNGISLRWNRPASAAADDRVVYRAVSQPEAQPYWPDIAETFVVTEETSAFDGRPPLMAVRHYQIWAYIGPDEDAVWAQPILVAEGAVVAPPQDVRIVEDGGRVIGSWRLLPGASRALIFRVPESLASSTPPLSPEHGILTDSANLTGFRDSATLPDGALLYRIVAEAPVGGRTQLSPLVTQRISPSPRLEPVTDLACACRETPDGPRFDLMWFPPARGTVTIYRSREHPAQGIDRPAPAETLGQLGLGVAIPDPVDVADDGRASITGATWPNEWARVYLTPVTSVNGLVHPGPTTVFVRVPPVADPVIHQRVSHQRLVFQWPLEPITSPGDPDTRRIKAADAVQVFQASATVPPEIATTESPLVEVSAERYDRDGGVIFNGQLDPTGSLLHLVPIAFSGQRKIAGPVATVAYPGLIRVWYSVERAGFGRGRGGRRVTVRLRADRHVSPAPRFVAVHHPGRLPLDPGDGTVMEMSIKDDPTVRRTVVFGPAALTTGWTSESWTTQMPPGGFLRVFAHVAGPAHAVLAVLDPPVRDLRGQ